jgi:hypothetical protein
MKKPRVSFPERVVEVKSVRVVESILVPVDRETPEVEMEFDPIVGSAVPPLTRAVFTVTVPESAMMCQPVIVQLGQLDGRVT